MELKLYPQHIEKSFVRGQNNTNTIFLYVGNIYKDSEKDFDKFVKGLNFIFVNELICRTIMNELNCSELCVGKHHCPIAKLLRKHLYNYDIKLNNKERYKI